MEQGEKRTKDGTLKKVLTVLDKKGLLTASSQACLSLHAYPLVVACYSSYLMFRAMTNRLQASDVRCEDTPETVELKRLRKLYKHIYS